MAKSKPLSLGTKRTCPDCGAKFYDLDKQDGIECPKCNAVFDLEELLLMDSSPSISDSVKKANGSSSFDDSDIDLEDDEDDDEEEGIEIELDDSDLDDDEEDSDEEEDDDDDDTVAPVDELGDFDEDPFADDDDYDYEDSAYEEGTHQIN